MDEVAYAAALALAGVFAVAGTAKLRRRAVTARTFASLGLGASPALALGVPVVELALAAGLVVAPAEAGVAAVAILAGFTTFLVLAIRRGEAVGCGCFGSSQAAPVGGAEVLRNAVLGVAAAVVVAGVEGPVVPRLPAVVLVIVAGAAAGTAVAFARRRGWLEAQPMPATGHEAPSIHGVDYEASELTLVAFLSTTCDGCDELRSSLRHLDRPGVQIRVVDLHDRTVDTFTGFGVRSTPYLVAVDSRGRVSGGGAARSLQDVQRLVTARSPDLPPPPEPAPASGPRPPPARSRWRIGDR